MTIEGVDWVATGPSPAELKAAGKTFALRYIDRHDYPSLSPAEAAALHAAGIDVGLIAEWGNQRMTGGAAAGTADGQRAKAALAALGAPAGTVVYFCADWDVQNASFPAVDAYLTAAAAVIGKAATGIYSGLRTIRHCQLSGSASHFWQTYAWSGTPTIWATGTHLQQYHNGQTVAGHTVDLDRAVVAQWGQWSVSPPDTSSGATPMHSFHGPSIGGAHLVGPGTSIIPLDGSPWDGPWAAGVNWSIYGEESFDVAIPGGPAGEDRVSFLLVRPTTTHDGKPWPYAKPAALLNKNTDWPAGKTAAPIAVPPPDTTPFAQADIDDAKAAGYAAAKLAASKAVGGI